MPRTIHFNIVFDQNSLCIPFPRAAGLQEDGKGFLQRDVVVSVHLHQIWATLNKRRSEAAIGGNEFSAVHLLESKQHLKNQGIEIPPDLTADLNTMAWIQNNVERGQYRVNDLSKVRGSLAGFWLTLTAIAAAELSNCRLNFPLVIAGRYVANIPLEVKSCTPEAKDGMAQHTQNQTQNAFQMTTNGLVPINNTPASHPSYLDWQRRLFIFLLAEVIVGARMTLQGANKVWVTIGDILIYWAHIMTRVIYAPANIRMEFSAARLADLEYRQVLMMKIRDGMTLGEAIHASMDTLRVLIHYDIPTKNSIRDAQPRTPKTPKTPKAQPKTKAKAKSSPRKSPFKTINKPRGNVPRKEACRLFNEGKCTRKECRFQHVCSFPGCTKPNCKGAHTHQ